MGPCIRRLRRGKSFRYLRPDGRPVREPRDLQRIRSLVIPPAWKDVWICGSANGHLQAYGWDAKGRKQYRYHPLYRKTRDETKFSRMLAFGAVLAKIRCAVDKDLGLKGLPKNKVIAAVVKLLDLTSVRIGNDEYARENNSFGLTTMRNRHVTIEGTKLLFRFRGKSGQEHAIELTDRRLARILKECQELPGYCLFEYLAEDGCVCRIDSDDVNQYIRELASDDFTAKDFRTWAGTVIMARELAALGPASSETAGKAAIVSAIKQVSRKLGNRPATCRKYYIHPAILDSYLDGSLFPVMERGEEQNAAYSGLGLLPEEYSAMVVIASYQGNVCRQSRTNGHHRRTRNAGSAAAD
ncbi:MAG TPA: DNA topoisomerase IB [Bryobacteraceae bacterium]